MTLHFNTTGEARKAMVRAIEKETGLKAKYLGMPSAAYQIGSYKVEKDGTLSWEEATIDESSKVVDACVMATGTSPAEWENNEPEETAEDPSETETTDLEVSIPLDKVCVSNLISLLEAKGDLIKKALGIENTHIKEEDEKVTFPWFKDVKPEDAVSYTKFISKLCEMSVNQKRVTAKAKENENEKYAFRCFLLRLGFIGDEYKADRKVLLRNLEGSSAFKSGQKGGEQ